MKINYFNYIIFKPLFIEIFIEIFVEKRDTNIQKQNTNIVTIYAN